MGPRVTGCLLVAALAACGHRAGPERRLADDVGRQLGVRVERVRCPGGPYPKTCVAQVEGTGDLALLVTDTPDGLAWTLTDFVISTAVLAEEIAAALDDLGVAAEVDCAPTIRVSHVGDRVACRLHGGVEGAAWAKIVDEDARFELELALDPAAVAARTTPGDEAELLRRSLELDVDDPTAESDDDDDDGSGLDAGVPAAAGDAGPPPRSGT